MTADIIASPLFRRDSLAGWREVRVASWRWLLRPDVADELLVHSVCDPKRTGPSTIIKRGRHRTVQRVTAAAGEFYVKQFHCPDLRTRLRHLLRGSQANWEWSRFRLAVHREVPTADVVAIGHELNRSGDSGLITRGLIDVVPLDQWLGEQPSNLSLALRRRLSDGLGAMIGRMHRRGVTHRDLHAGNILVRCDEEDVQLWLVDLSPLRFRWLPVSRAEIGQNLGRLRHSLLRCLSSTDQTAFFRRYWHTLTRRASEGDVPLSGYCPLAPLGERARERGTMNHGRSYEKEPFVCDQKLMDQSVARGSGRPLSLTLSPETGARGQSRKLATSNLAPRAGLRDIAGRCHAVAVACWEQMDRKWARGNRKTILIDAPGVHCRGLAELGHEPLNALCRSPERSSLLTATSAISSTHFAGRNVTVIKQPLSESLPRRRTGWARRCWEMGHALHRRLIAAPLPICMLEVHSGGCAGDYLVIEAESDWIRLDRLLDEIDQLPNSDVLDLERKTEHLLQRFHELGFVHEQLDRSALEARRTENRWQVRFASLDPIRQIGKPVRRETRRAA